MSAPRVLPEVDLVVNDEEEELLSSSAPRVLPEVELAVNDEE